MKTKSKTAYIECHGCNRRMLDLSKLEKYLISNGYKVVKNPKKCDLILLGTCAFKEKEEDEAISRIRTLRNYDARLLIYGCLPDIAPAKFKEFSDIEFIAPKNIDTIDNYFKDNSSKFKDIASSNFIKYQKANSFFKNVIDKLFSKEIITREFYERSPKKLLNIFKNYFDYTSKNYKLFICRGCLGKCSYCAIKYSIGTVKSKQIETVVEELRNGIDSGYTNFIILGDDPGCYGYDINISFPVLLSRLVNEAGKYDNRKINFHINEIHPKWLIRYKKELQEILKSKIITSILCPIQSGSNRILKLMQREHTIEELRDVFKTIQRINPGIKISNQIMTGFPSETEEEFLETLDFVKDIRFDYTVIFPYHEKQITPSKELKDKIPEDIIQKRFLKGLKYLRKNRLRVYTSCP